MSVDDGMFQNGDSLDEYLLHTVILEAVFEIYIFVLCLSTWLSIIFVIKLAACTQIFVKIWRMYNYFCIIYSHSICKEMF